MAFFLPLLGMAGAGAGAGGGMALAAAGISAASALMAGAAESAAATHDAKLAAMNAQIERDNAARARLEGATAEEAQRRVARKALGETAAALAQSGAAGGSDQAIIRQSATEAELDALNIRYEHETRAGAHMTQAAMLEAERRNAKMRAKSAMIGGVLKAGGQLLSGVSDYGASRAASSVRTAQVSMSRPSSRYSAPKPSKYPKGG